MNAAEVARKITPEMRRAAQVVLLATAHAQMERATIDKLEREILAQGQYYAKERDRSQGRLERITDPKHVYLMDLESPEYRDYTARVQQGIRALGYTAQDVPDEYCPALMAEELQRKAERSLVDVCEPLVGLTFDAFFRGPKSIENLRKYLDLLLGALVNSPGGVPSPLKRGGVHFLPVSSPRA